MSSLINTGELAAEFGTDCLKGKKLCNLEPKKDPNSSQKTQHSWRVPRLINSPLHTHLLDIFLAVISLCPLEVVVGVSVCGGLVPRGQRRQILDWNDPLELGRPHRQAELSILVHPKSLQAFCASVYPFLLTRRISVRRFKSSVPVLW